MPGSVPTIDVEPVIEIPAEAAARLLRLRRVAWLLDRSIPIGGGRRIGIDPIIGLVPGLGDWLGAALSSWLIYEALRLGVPAPVLARMGLNVVIEAAGGALPVVGDVFDAFWQANQRNYLLIERHYDPRRRPRSLRKLLVVFALAVGLFLAGLAVLLTLIVRLVWGLFG